MQLPLGKKKKSKLPYFAKKKKKMLTTSVTLGRFSSLREIIPNFFPYNKISFIDKNKKFPNSLIYI